MDIEDLLRSLNAHNVEFVIIGATAFPIHGYARATLDIDLFDRFAASALVRVVLGPFAVAAGSASAQDGGVLID